MIAGTVNKLLTRAGRTVSPGAIFTKELRVASRRRRYYLLRFAYVAMLASVIAILWSHSYTAGGTHQPGYLSEVGKAIVRSVAWFQFIAAHVMAAVLLSDGISVEIRQRTLGLLATTPLTALRIAADKLFSKLWHVVLLLAISLPVLAIVRVFGGVPWSFVIATTGVTITATLFVGAISLFFSTIHYHPLSVMWRTAALYVILFMIVPAVAVPTALKVPFAPLMAMQAASDFMAGSLGAMRYLAYWPVNCGLMLFLTFLTLLATAYRIRRIATNPSVSGGRIGRQKKRTPPQNIKRKPSPAELRKAIRRVHGAPLVWKELRFYMPAGRKQTILASMAVAAVIASSYAGMGSQDMLDYAPTHLLYGQVYFWCGAIVLGLLAPRAITTERSGGTLTLLLTTPISDGRIVLAKAIGVFRQAMPAWIVLFAHLVLFVAMGVIHPAVLPLMAIVSLSTGLFLTGVGLYWSTRLHSSVSAVIASAAVVAVAWILPGFLLTMATAPGEVTVSRYAIGMTPAVQVAVTVQGCVNGDGGGFGREFIWPSEILGLKDTTFMVLQSLTVHAFAGLLFAWRAKALLRQKLF